MRELIYKDEAYKAIDNCICDGWYRISPSEAKMNICHLVSDVNETNRPQGKWMEKAISIIDDMQSEGIIDYEQAREYRMRVRMEGANDETI